MEVNQVLAAVLFACLALSSIDEANSASYNCGKECQEAAKKVKSYLDEKVKPCDDFYEFACGNFDKGIADIPAGEESYQNLETPKRELIFKLGKELMDEADDATSFETDKKTRKIYAACTGLTAQDKDGITPMQNIISQLGGWPVAEGPSWTPAKPWDDVMLDGNNLGLDTDYFLKIYVANANNGVVTFWITSERSELGAKTPPSKVTSYKDYMVEAAKLFGATESYARQEMEKVYAFEAELSKHATSEGHTKGIYKLKDLESLFVKTNLSVKKFLQTAVGAASTGSRLQSDDEVIVYGFEKYFREAAKVFEKTDSKTIQNYIIWRAVRSKMTSLGSAARTMANKYQETANGVKPEPKSRECLKLVGFNELYSPLLGAGGSLFIRKHFKQSYATAIQDTHAAMKKSLADIIDSTQWMDAKTKQMAKAKVQAAKVIVSAAPELSQKTKVDNLFADLSGISRTSHVNNLLAISKYSSKQKYRIVKNQIAANDWTRNLRTAFPKLILSRTTNTIKIMAGESVGGIYSSKFPEYMNYGFGAHSIAVLLARSFDKVGIRYDATGKRTGLWLTPKEKTYYDNNVKCFENQYNKVEIPDLPGVKLSARIYRETIFIGNSALRLAYKAYGDYVKNKLSGQQETSLPGLGKYSPKQLFWIGYGQASCAVYKKEALENAAAGRNRRLPVSVHALHVMNRKEFAADFQCADNAPMNPTAKCEMW